MNEFEAAQWDEEEVEIEAIGVEVDEQPIELYKVLKIANVVSGGGEAKYAIAEGYVAVNGEIETRKRRKLYDSDLVEFDQEYYLIICDAPVTEAEPKPVKQAEKKAPPAAKKKGNNSQSSADKKKSADKNKAASKKGAQAGKKGQNKAHPLSQSAKPSKSKATPDKAAADNNADNTPSQSEGGRNAIRFF